MYYGGKAMRPTHMTITAEQVYAKAKAFVDALGKLPRSQSAQVPHGHFARDYNNLRKLAIEACPSVDERLLGKYVRVRSTAGGEELSQASYVEIETFARQILEQLAILVGVGQVSVPVHAGASWTPAEDEGLVREFDAGRTISELAELHQRNEGGIRSRSCAWAGQSLCPPRR